MNPKKSLQLDWRWWTFSLAGVLLLLGPFSAVDAQTSKLKITTTGAESVFAPVLSQPMKLMKALEITSEEIKKQLTAGPQISVSGAGYVRNLGLTALTKGQKSNQSLTGIKVSGASSVREFSLTAPNTP